jgi:hypothetical protein
MIGWHALLRRYVAEHGFLFGVFSAHRLSSQREARRQAGDIQVVIVEL